MKISNVQSGGICRIKLEGALSIESVTQTKDGVMKALPRKGGIELDLSDVTGCDAAGVQLLLMLRAEMCARERQFATTPLPPPVLQLMETVGLAIDALAATGI